MEMDDGQNQEQNPPKDNHNSRDPKHINTDIQVDFEDLFAEPDGTQSNDSVWKASYSTFTGSKNCCYRCLTMMCGVPCSMMWGCNYACSTFNYIWCFVPWVKSFKFGFKCMGQCFSMMFEHFFEKLFTSFGKILSNMNLTIRKEN